jgi:regulator of protease activity HflC (stomatin/prohibitin superfamily)
LLRNEIANFEGSSLPARQTPEPAALTLAPRDFAKEGGSYAQIRSERGLLNRRIEDFCREQIGDRYGVHFNAVDLVDILPPDELAEALNAVMNAQTDAEAQYFRAEAETQKNVLSATEGVEIARLRAHAVEVEILKLGEYLKTLKQTGTLADYVQRRKNEVMSQSRTVYVKESA